MRFAKVSEMLDAIDQMRNSTDVYWFDGKPYCYDVWKEKIKNSTLDQRLRCPVCRTPFKKIRDHEYVGNCVHINAGLILCVG
jgi:hypothetical protein